MSAIKDYINSGILEMYVLGITNPEETLEVNEMAIKHIEIRQEIDEIVKALEIDATKTSVKPSEALGPMILAVVDYTERLKSGEPVTFPPLLTKDSKIIDFEEWTSRVDMVLPDDYDSNMYAKLIGHMPEAITAISWIKTHAPFEIHTTEYERFLILEGSCDITIGETIHHLVSGDFLAIPLHIGHSLVVTSSIPCKVILQRVAV